MKTGTAVLYKLLAPGGARYPVQGTDRGYSIKCPKILL